MRVFLTKIKQLKERKNFIINEQLRNNLKMSPNVLSCLSIEIPPRGWNSTCDSACYARSCSLLSSLYYISQSVTAMAIPSSGFCP